MNKELLKYCRYYHGEKDEKTAKIKDAESRFFWNVERMWIQFNDENHSFSEELDTYLNAQMQHFSETDDTPVTLKALMFQYFFAVNSHVTTEDFKELYKRY